MQFLIYFLIFLSSVRCAVIPDISSNDDVVWESDKASDLSSQTIMVGEPYVMNTKSVDIKSVNTESLSRVSALIAPSPSSAVVVMIETSADKTDSSVVLTSAKSTFTTMFANEQVETSGKITTLLTLSASTTTSILFSTSGAIQSSLLNGTTLTSIPTNSRNPLVTQKPSQSAQSTVINPVTLSANKTLPATSETAVYSSMLPFSNVTSERTFYSTVYSLAGSSLSNPSAASQNFNSSATASTTGKSSLVATSGSLPSGTTQITKPLLSTSQIIASSESSQTGTSEPTVTSPIITTSSASPSSSSSPSTAEIAQIVNLFDAISTETPPNVFPRAPNPMSLADGVSNDGPVQTNKFYTNLIVGSQNSAAFVYPYSLRRHGSGQDIGIAVQHTTTSQYSFGNYDSNGNSQFLINPLNIGELVLSSANFDSAAAVKVDNMKTSSATVKLVQGASSEDYLELPLVQGMGFATGVYHGSLIAKLGSEVGFKTLLQEKSQFLADGILKYRVELLNGFSWLCYIVVPDNMSKDDFKLQAQNAYSVTANLAVDGLIMQVAIAPDDSNLEVFYDEAAGMYAYELQLSGSSDGNVANYEFQYATEGESLSGNTMIFALPHHANALISSMENSYTGIQVQSTTKGTMKGYLATRLLFSQKLNRQISWLPWSPLLGSADLKYSSEQLKLLAEVANKELQVSIASSISQLNTYYIGKVIDKYAYILLTVSQIIGDEVTTRSTLANLKTAFDTLLKNKQLYPLIYDTKFSGLVSSGDWASTSTQYDFGNTYYNDHHFHYGYIIHAAAVVGYVDKQLGGNWAEENKDWVNTLVRDVANPSEDDTYFAQSRMFDWYHGHSWAAGLFENGNGKNQESSSEDYNFAYGMKLWGSVIEDSSMELRGDLMISIMAESMGEYYLYLDSNQVEPREIIGNKVCGILFDNIIDYTTYFGTNVEYKHGIHMLPITPVSGQIRQVPFVQEEWQEKLAPIISSINSGWTGILKLNQALFDPADSYEFFSDPSFNSDLLLDGGMSRTWSLAFSGGLANSMGLL
ncbi:hypothetical protein HG536_0E05770 [Torulaspora globosa]|uniref:Glucan endo-1,3-beta-D-glucosidase 1 n=1 Tax=Torulaspora globosa TaxID=48254 RepID=A0A7G3ZJI0_9SACH|nr:uncharacterized protein HG536_0E05770 [Torulaspora globosa]QLL33666.1 hypothetical protein HG536_0E05770 [Torulaspora globosa]